MTLRDFITNAGLDPLVVLDQELDALVNNLTVRTSVEHSIGTTTLTANIVLSAPGG